MTLQMPPRNKEPSAREVGAIVADMWENGEKLARQEIALGLSELQLRADKLKRSLLEGAIAGAIYNAGMLALLTSVVLGLSVLMAPWLAAALVGLAALGVGYALQTRAAQQAAQTTEPRREPALKEGNS